MRSASTRAHPVSDKPLDLDKHRGMAAQKATDIRRILADVENNAKALRDRQGIFENQLLSAPAASWPEAAAKARYVLNLYAAGLAPADTHHRDLVAAVLADFARLSDESCTKPVVRRTTRSFTPRSISKIERPPESTLHARSFSASRQDRRVAPARCRIGLVQHQGERNICLGAA